MKCLVCKNNNILEAISRKKIICRFHPFGKRIICSDCGTSYSMILLFGSFNTLKYIVTTHKRRPILIARARELTFYKSLKIIVRKKFNSNYLFIEFLFF